MSGTVTESAVREMLRTQLAEILYTEAAEISDDTTFEDLGLDSVLSVELAAVINSRYGLDEKIEVMYQYPTVRTLAAHVVSTAGDKAVAAQQ